MTEELHDVRLQRQRRRARRRGARPAAALRRAAPRLRPDRHPRRLRARRLRRLHGAGRRPADALVPDVRGLRGRRRDHHRRGADRGRRLARARCSRRSPSATGCSAASARPASSPRSPPGCARTPTPTEDEAREMIAGNLCRCTGYQNIVEVGAARRRDPAAVSAPMTTKLFGAKVQRVEDQRFLRGQGRYVDDVAVGPRHAARRRAALAARPRPDRSTSTSTTCSTSRACTRSGPTTTSTGADGRAAAAADPAPDADPRPHAVRAGQGRGQLRRRGDRLRRRRRPLRRRGRRRPDPGRLRVPRRRWSASRPPGRPTHLVHEDVPGNVGARMEQEQRRRPRRRSPPRRTRSPST